MKLKTKLIFPEKEIGDLIYINNLKFSEENHKDNCIDYQNKKDFIVCCDKFQLSIPLLLITN